MVPEVPRDADVAYLRCEAVGYWSGKWRRAGPGHHEDMTPFEQLDQKIKDVVADEGYMGMYDLEVQVSPGTLTQMRIERGRTKEAHTLFCQGHPVRGVRYTGVPEDMCIIKARGRVLKVYLMDEGASAEECEIYQRLRHDGTSIQDARDLARLLDTAPQTT